MPQCSTPEHWRLIYELRVQVPWSDGERQERHHRIRHLSYKNWLKRPRSEWPYWVRFNAAVIELTKVNPFSETSYV